MASTRNPYAQASHGVIDMHAHWTPAVLAELLRKRDRVPFIVPTGSGETYHAPYEERPFRSLETDLHERIAFMNARGITMQALSLPGLFGVDSLPAEEAMPLVALFNDETARACQQWPTRFAGLAALPLADMTLACEELRRAHAIGLRGAILPSDGFASLEVARQFEPLLDVAASLGSHLFIHPGPLAGKFNSERGGDGDAPWLRSIVLGAQSRLTEVMVTLNWSNLLDPWPDLSVQVANLGGALPFYAERIAQVTKRQLGDDRPVPPQMRRCLVDVSSFGPLAIGLTVRCLGADRVVFGSDCPIFSTRSVVEALEAAPISDEERILIRSANAARALGLSEPTLEH